MATAAEPCVCIAVANGVTCCRGVGERVLIPRDMVWCIFINFIKNYVHLKIRISERDNLKEE